MSGVHPHRAARIMMVMMVVITVDVIAASTLQHRGHAAFNSQDVSFFTQVQPLQWCTVGQLMLSLGGECRSVVAQSSRRLAVSSSCARSCVIHALTENLNFAIVLISDGLLMADRCHASAVRCHAASVARWFAVERLQRRAVMDHVDLLAVL